MRFVPIGLLAMAFAAPAGAQDAPAPPPAGSQPAARENRAATVGTFLGGAALALGVHESGHVVFGHLFGSKTGLEHVHFGPIPFFAITYSGELSPRRQFAVSSAGFWMQQAASEAVLSARPGLRDSRAPLLKGMLAFDILASVAYAGAAFAHAGPAERDTRAMADRLHVDEAWVGALVLAPAVIDAVRYRDPGAAWARWTSRGIKVGMVLLILRAR